MKKLLLIGCAIVATMAASAASHPVKVPQVKASSVAMKVTPTNSEILQEPGEGTTVNPAYASSRRTWLVYQNTVASISDNDAYASEMVYSDTKVYIKNIASRMPTNSWIEGDVQPDGTVTFSFPQHIYHVDATATAAAYDVYVAVLTPTSDGTSTSLVLDPENCDLHMKWEGDRLCQITTEASESSLKHFANIIGLINGNGTFIGFGEQNFNISKEQFALPIPDLSSLTPEDYTFSYTDEDEKSQTATVSIAVDGNDVWAKGFNEWVPEAWIKGSVENGNFTFPSQYAGIYEGMMLFTGTPAGDETNFSLEAVKFNKVDNTFLAEKQFTVNIGNRTAYAVSTYNNGFLSPYDAVDATPADPTGFEPEPYSDAEGMGLLYFVIPTTDTEGNELDKSKLYYNIYTNDELYTFTPGYDGCENEMTDVPVSYNCDTLMSTGDGGIIFIFLEPLNSVGVRSLYKGATATRYSNIVTLNFNDAISTTLYDKEAVRTDFYDLQGRKAVNPESGLYIRVSRYADGTTASHKVFIVK